MDTKNICMVRKNGRMSDYEMLPDAGRVTHQQAEEKALAEYEKFRVIQDREIMSDFDRELKSLFEDY